MDACDRVAERHWRHLNSCRFLTNLDPRAPHVSCPVHGMPQLWLQSVQSCSRLADIRAARAADVLLAANVAMAAPILGISWDEAWHLA